MTHYFVEGIDFSLFVNHSAVVYKNVWLLAFISGNGQPFPYCWKQFFTVYKLFSICGQLNACPVQTFSFLLAASFGCGHCFSLCENRVFAVGSNLLQCGHIFLVTGNDFWCGFQYYLWAATMAPKADSKTPLWKYWTILKQKREA